MKKERGLTLMELIIVLAFIGILAAVIENHVNGIKTQGDGTYCKAGYLFSQNGYARSSQDRQMIGANGGGIQCQ